MMFSSLLSDYKGRRGRSKEVEVGDNININRSIPTLTTSTTYIFTLACSWEKYLEYLENLEKCNLSVFREVGEVVEVGGDLMLSVFSLPLTKWRGSFLPLPSSLEAFL
jgi:hypothetical protein